MSTQSNPITHTPADTIRIELDTVRAYRNKHEWRTTQRATSTQGHEITGDGPIVAKLASILRRENPLFEGLLVVCRGDTPVFLPTPLKQAFMKGPQPLHLRKKAA